MIRLHPKHRAATTESGLIFFGKKQFAIITALVEANGHYVSKYKLASDVWCDGDFPPDPLHTLKDTINRLQRNITTLGAAIESVGDAGYRLLIEVAAA